MRRSNCAGAMQYIPELTWILFLRIFDEQETHEAQQIKATGKPYPFSIPSPYRWQDWGNPTGSKRLELQLSSVGAFFRFVNEELIPYLKALKNQPDVTSRQRVISQIVSSIDTVKIDTEENLIEILDKVHEIRYENVDKTHIFPISQVYEGLLLKMGEKSNDGGQFFTPREIVRAMVRATQPQNGETVYDPSCGTGGFLAESYAFICQNRDRHLHQDLEPIKNTFYGREKENLIYPIALANLVLHGLDEPHLWHGNTLTRQGIYEDLFQDAPHRFDIILTNPPFGGKEGKEVQSRFAFKTSSTQVLFLQDILNSLKPGGRCGIVLDEGVLFRTSEAAFLQTKQRLLQECDLWCIVSLPEGVFANAGTTLKTNLLFFTKGKPTEQIWYYDLSYLKVSKKNLLSLEDFEDFFKRLPTKSIGSHSWTISREEIEAKNFDLKAVNPHQEVTPKVRSREELLALLKVKNRDLSELLQDFKRLMC
ncbi:N-6 DNA methylase [Phormidium pseudopriestleyi FRX01]|uniref:site-specific DNA-methyltransferase (adenine-specific) n=2 Tax=Phormidium TaxID=1198 RepID=A0ABS3FL66_9CYAN|nr:N-6 DNA methylase [Phormidium pseudopriestleyi FRX01]